MPPAPAIPPDADMLFPAEPTTGAIGAFAKYDKLDQIKQLERERRLRVWEVRAYISDHVPLAGGVDAALARPSYHLLHLNENPLWIYLHSGGRNAVYYGLFGDEGGKLQWQYTPLSDVRPMFVQEWRIKCPLHPKPKAR